MSSLGLYVHVPFCQRICPYCDFAVVREPVLSPAVEHRYLDALLRELEVRRPPLAQLGLATLYLGGGTPSLLRPESVARLVAAGREAFAGPPEPALPVEVTLEVNPSTVERERLPAFREAGVTRLSIGVQSFDDTVLRRLGRAHRAHQARQTLAAARAAGFENLSIDLIFAAPGSSGPQLAADLDQVAAHQPEHVSIYELTVESGTPFALAQRRGQLACPDEDDLPEMMGAIETKLTEAGLCRYELSNYARPGHESRHNRRYWRRQPVLGLGLGAWSSLPPADGAPYGLREANPRSLVDYLAAVEAGASPVGQRERLSRRTAQGEAVMLGLRQIEGVDAARFQAEFGESLRARFSCEIDAMTRDALLLEVPPGDLRLSARGRLFADEVARAFV